MRSSSTACRAAAALALALAAGPAWAQPGASPNAPRPAAPDAVPAPEADLEQRQAVRGCPTDQACHDDHLRDLVEFERAAFPRPADDASPWGADDDAPPPAAGEAAAPAPPKPSALDPKHAWMDDLRIGDLPVRWDARVVRFVDYYVKDPRGQRLMRDWLRAQGAYRELILAELRAAKLPEDLLYVAMIESSYDSRERSRVGASGLWQFMPGGGKIYGLRQDRWIDERNDPVKATRAVMGYWQDLDQRFGNWHLSLAAFNAGYGAVIKGIAKYNTNDFWRLLDHENALPWESSVYVPKALACAIVGHNREALGFGDVVDAPAFVFDVVTVPRSTSLAAIARTAKTTVAELQRLNPQLRQGRTPPGIKDYAVRIPRGAAARFALDDPELRADWEAHATYTLRQGERFEDVATRHGIARAKLRELNGIASESELSGGATLIVPVVSEDALRANQAKADDELYAAGVPAGAPGDPLLVAVPDPGVRVEGKRRVFYRVVTGDSLFAVAEALGVDRRALAGWNQLDPEAHLHPRMVLQAWVAPGFDPTVAGVKLLDDRRLEVVAVGSQAHLERAEARMGRERTTYTAKRRETYEQIGKRYGLTARDLARINKLPFDTVLQPGETCVVYAVKDRTASDRAAAQARAAAPAKKQRGKATKGAAKAKPAAAKAKPAAKAAAEAKRDRPK